MRALLLALAITGASAAPAAAGQAITLFPLSAGKLPTAFAKLPQQFTQALAKSIHAEVANVPIEDAAGLLDCDPEVSTCIEAVGKSVKAKRIVFGTINVDEDRVVRVTLTRFDPGPERQQRTFELSSTSPDEMADELVRVSAPLFGGKAPPPPPRDKPRGKDDKTPPEPKETGLVDEGTIDDGKVDDGKVDEPKHADTVHGSISGTTWGILGGGAVIGGLGVLFLVQASGIADDVRSAPRDTPQDFARLTALESKGETRQRLGIGLGVVGAVGVAYGIYRAITEHSAHGPEATAMRVTPVPIEGGAALVLTMGVR